MQSELTGGDEPGAKAHTAPLGSAAVENVPFGCVPTGFGLLLLLRDLCTSQTELRMEAIMSFTSCFCPAEGAGSHGKLFMIPEAELVTGSRSLP